MSIYLPTCISYLPTAGCGAHPCALCTFGKVMLPSALALTAAAVVKPNVRQPRCRSGAAHGCWSRVLQGASRWYFWHCFIAFARDTPENSTQALS